LKPCPNKDRAFLFKEDIMKINFEKIFFYFMLVLVSGSIGYAIKPEPVKENSNSTQIRECVQAMHMMQNTSKKNYYISTAKTKKQAAIERMMRN
jgi:hypothetical protein